MNDKIVMGSTCLATSQFIVPHTCDFHWAKTQPGYVLSFSLLFFYPPRVKSLSTTACVVICKRSLSFCSLFYLSYLWAIFLFFQSHTQSKWYDFSGGIWLTFVTYIINYPLHCILLLLQKVKYKKAILVSRCLRHIDVWSLECYLSECS